MPYAPFRPCFLGAALLAFMASASALAASGCSDRGALAQPRQPRQPQPQQQQQRQQQQVRPPQQQVRPDAGPARPDAGAGSSRLGGEPGFFGAPDAPTVARLNGGTIATVERGRGGRSVGFKITLSDGTKGYYKPEQTFSAAHWYAEIAAFHLDRELGLGRVPPVVGRRFEWSALRRYIAGDARASEVIVGEDGFVRGCFVWWIPEPRLQPWRTSSGWERWVRMQGVGGAVSPFQRARVYVEQNDLRHAALDGGVRVAPGPDAAVLQQPRSRRGGVAPDMPERPAELSDMILFDFLTNNIDRWGGGNANVLTRGRPGPIVFLDNAAGFIPRQSRNGIMDARLHVLQRFRRRTVDAIRAFDMQRYTRRLSTDALSPVLTSEQLTHLETRRQTLLEHVADMQQRYGDAIYSW